MADADEQSEGIREHLPLFPLPNVVFFPGTDLPLHVFEPRYRELIAHSLNNGRVIGVPLLKPGYEADYDGRPPIHEIMGIGTIMDAEELADGRWNIILHGIERVRVVEELPPVHSFRMVHAEKVADIVSEAPACETTLRKLALRLADLVPEVKQPLQRLLTCVQEGGVCLADQLACRLVPDPQRRQAILEERDPCKRAWMVTEEVAEVCLRVDPTCGSGDGPAN